MHLLIYNLCKPRGLDPVTADRIAWRRTWIVIITWSVAFTALMSLNAYYN